MKCLEVTDSNGIELYLFQLEGNLFVSVPKDQLEFKPLSSEELKKLENNERNENPLERINPKPIPTKKHIFKYLKGTDDER